MYAIRSYYEPLERGEIGAMLKDVLQPHQKALLEKNLSVDFGYGVHGLARFRCNVYLQRGTLAAAVAQQELGRLVKIPGIGKKTAERLLLELKGKLAQVGGVTLSVAADDARADISNALLALGYNEKEAAAALKQLPADVGTSDGIRQALKLLSKGS